MSIRPKPQGGFQALPPARSVLSRELRRNGPVRWEFRRALATSQTCTPCPLASSSRVRKQDTNWTSAGGRAPGLGTTSIDAAGAFSAATAACLVGASSALGPEPRRNSWPLHARPNYYGERGSVSKASPTTLSRSAASERNWPCPCRQSGSALARSSRTLLHHSRVGGACPSPAHLPGKTGQANA
jgi:hypothetical protein